MSSRIVLALVLAGCGASPAPAPDRPVADTDPACTDTTWFPDTDGDGVGDASRGSSAACEAPQGWVALDGDCNDLDAAVFPGAPEVCDRIDQDCDGTVDDDAVDAAAWHADADADGFGDATDVTRSCAQPADRVADATDCDDADPTVSPAAYEVCGGVDEDCDGSVDEGDAANADTFYVDADGDGFGDAGGTVRACERPDGHVTNTADCDDADALTSPEGVEVCGGADENCDGEVDEDDAVDAPAWRADTDADGFGDAADAHRACLAPPGRVADLSDCDDTDGVVFPGADEHCDGRDDDCDGAADEDDAVDAPMWYADADIDGHGDPGNTTAACERPYGYTADATDCDDARNDVHPGVPENCLTAEDEDCDDADVDGIGCVDWYADLDGDGHAGDPSSVCACSAHDVYTSTTATDCDDEDPLAYAGAPEIWGDGIDQSCGNDGDAADLLTEAVPLYGVAAGDQAGYSLAADGDPDGDGLQGLVVGAPGAESRGGAVYVFATPPTASASLGGADLVLVGSTAGDLVGTSIDTGDIDGDGVADIAVGSTVIGPAGGATVVYGGRTGVHDLATSDLAYLPAEGYAAGHAVAFVGDLDGDGADNLVLGDPTASAEGKPEAGVVHVFGAPSGESPVTEEGIRLTGSSTFGDAGYALLGPGDLDGDGLDDLVVSDPRWSGAGPLNAGAVYVLHGPVTDGDLDTTADVRIEGSHAYAYIGIALARAGDADGDGAPDVLVAASGTGGGVYLVTAPAAGSLVDGARAWLSLSSATSVAGGGDLDADGAGDFVVGQPTGASYSRAGHAYVLYGPAAGTVDLDDTAISLSGGRYSYAGAAVRIVGDTDGDGHDDVLVGAWGDPTRGSQAGVAWFLSGGSL